MKGLYHQKFLEIGMCSLQLASERGTSIGLDIVKFMFRLWDRVTGRGTPRFLQCILMFVFL